MPIINRYRQASYTKGAAQLVQLPPDSGMEVAFAGRSNAGKSSALNTLCEQKALARTSKTPGRTQLINIFALDAERRLIDLPGYGFAKVSLDIKQRWQATLAQYLQQRDCLRGLILLSDIRHPLKDTDQEMLEWAAEVGLATHLLLSKADKLKSGAAKNTLLKVKRQVSAIHPECSVQTFSALKRQGVETLLTKLDQWFEWPEEPESDSA